MTDQQPFILETSRCILRLFTMADDEVLFHLDSDPEVHRYLGNRPLKNIDQAREVIKNIRHQYRSNGIGRLAVVDRSTGEFMGWAGLKLETREVNGHRSYYDLGYRLAKRFWGNGIASECAAASLGIGFNEHQLEVINAAAHTENIASNKVLQKNGFTLKNTFRFDGATHNWYELTRKDWILGRPG